MVRGLPGGSSVGPRPLRALRSSPTWSTEQYSNHLDIRIECYKRIICFSGYLHEIIEDFVSLQHLELLLFDLKITFQSCWASTIAVTDNFPVWDVVEHDEVAEHGDEADKAQAGHYVDHRVLQRELPSSTLQHDELREKWSCEELE